MPLDSRPAEKPFLHRYRLPLTIGVIFIAILALRLIHLDADSPLGLSWSGGYFGDEMALAHNARNKVLFGEWISDEWNPYIYSPLLTLLEYAFFSFLGVGLIPLRLVNIFVLFLGFWLLLLTLRRERDWPTALLAVGLLGFNYIFLMYNRIGLNDTFLVFPMLLTLYLWHRGLEKPPYFILAGVSAFICYTTKATALYFTLAAALSLVWAILQKVQEAGGLKKGLRSLGFFLGGLGLSCFAWYRFFFLPNQGRFDSAVQDWVGLAMPENLGRFWSNVTSPLLLKYFSLSPVELLVGLSFIPWLFLTLFKDWKKIKPLEVFLSLWLLGGYLAINGLNYRPLRYYVPLLPPLIILTALLLSKIWNRSDSGNFNLKPVLTKGWLFILWILFVSQYSLGYKELVMGTLALLGLVSIFMLVLLTKSKLLGLAMSGSGRDRGIRLFLRSAVAGLIGFSLIIHGAQYYRWVRSPAYTVRNTSRELGRLSGEVLIAGLWAPLATIENRHRSLYLGKNWFNYKKTFFKYPVTHLFLWDGNNKEELLFLIERYPKIMERAILIKTYHINKFPVRFYKINR
jgi:4-amino-4-deoxy-L-arabinose transferase-like glycosyltransferase